MVDTHAARRQTTMATPHPRSADADYDPLADLIPKQKSAAAVADEWGGRFMKLTLTTVFVDISLFIAFMLAQTNLVPMDQVSKVLEYWPHLAIATLAALVATCLAAIFKMVYEIAR